MNAQVDISDLQAASFWNQPSIHSSILVDVREAISQKIAPHTLRILKPGQRLNSQIQFVELGSTSMMYINYGADVIIEPGTIDNAYILDIPLTGVNYVSLDGDKSPVNPGLLSITPVTKPIRFLQERECSLLTLKIDRITLEHYLIEQTGRPLQVPIEFQLLSRFSDEKTQSFLRVLIHVCDLIQQKHSSLEQIHVVDTAERYLLTTLLNTVPNNYSRRLVGIPSVSEEPPAYLLQAENYILDNLNQSLNLDDLVKVTKISARSLFMAFKKFRGTSPMAFVRTERLHKVRTELLNSDSKTTTVTDVALKWRFLNLGSFSALYANKYGEKPSYTLRQRMSKNVTKR